MKYSVKLSPKAIEDLDEIEEYISQNLKNPSAAVDTVNGILDALEVLEDFPETGANLYFEANISSGYRYVIYKNYLAFYRVLENSVFADRVIYGKRDYMSILFGDRSDQKPQKIV